MPDLVVSLKGRELSRHSLGLRTHVGRDPSMDVVIDNPGVSRHHATVVYDAGKYVIRDENSQNGMFVREQRVAHHVLADGDQIQLGKFALSFTDLEVAPRGRTEGEAVGPRAPGMMKTFALNAAQVQSMLAAHAAPDPAEVEPDLKPPASKVGIVAAGFAVLVAVVCLMALL
jgi:predicted component of type VI protein secretion system